MAIDLFCYTSLGPVDAADVLDGIKRADSFDYGADFILSAPRAINARDREVSSEFTSIRLASLFLVRLNNKSLLDRQTISNLVSNLKSGFPDLLVLQDNEHIR